MTVADSGSGRNDTTLCGFTSPCTMPAACRCVSAVATSNSTCLTNSMLRNAWKSLSSATSRSRPPFSNTMACTGVVGGVVGGVGVCGCSTFSSVLTRRTMRRSSGQPGPSWSQYCRMSLYAALLLSNAARSGVRLRSNSFTTTLRSPERTSSSVSSPTNTLCAVPCGDAASLLTRKRFPSRKASASGPPPALVSSSPSSAATVTWTSPSETAGQVPPSLAARSSASASALLTFLPAASGLTPEAAAAATMASASPRSSSASSATVV
mmetsp:Transcript_27364/g.94706  ORF Transcript_27364/g.94706 Transcript_27364/m.94706 type:complete len:266 (-) Transcript_27364:121-918(-)